LPQGRFELVRRLFEVERDDGVAALGEGELPDRGGRRGNYDAPFIHGPSPSSRGARPRTRARVAKPSIAPRALSRRFPRRFAGARDRSRETRRALAAIAFPSTAKSIRRCL